jgi:hypothetical protein
LRTVNRTDCRKQANLILPVISIRQTGACLYRRAHGYHLAPLAIAYKLDKGIQAYHYQNFSYGLQRRFQLKRNFPEEGWLGYPRYTAQIWDTTHEGAGALTR